MRIAITGAAGYIGSLLTARLLADGHETIAIDRLLFGGDSLLAFFGHPRFSFAHRDVTSVDCEDLLGGVDVVYHLAAIVGFPACRDIGEPAARLFNVEATKRMFSAAERRGVARFVLASTYSNYGIAKDDRPVTELDALRPQSLYAETKIEAERYLLERTSGSRCAPIIPRFT